MYQQMLLSLAKNLNYLITPIARKSFTLQWPFFKSFIKYGLNICQLITFWNDNF